MITTKTDISSIAVLISPPAIEARNRLWLGEFVRYLIASAFALGLDCGLLLGLTHVIHIHYLPAAGIGFFVGLIFTYFASTRWVFNTRQQLDEPAQFLIFSAVGLTGLILNNVVLWVAVDHYKYSLEFSKILSAGLVFSSNFILRKILLFK